MRKKGDMLAGKPADDDFYGIAYQAGKAYDFSTMQVNAFIWQYGGNIWDETQAPKGHAEGVVNSPEAVKALDHYLRLTKYMPPVVKTGGMDIFKTDELFREGKVASHIQWIGFAESSINPETSKVADKVAFAQAPGLKGPDGKLIRWANIGGQPFVIMTWSTDAADQGDRRLREVVAVARGAAPIRRAGRPERHQVGLQRSEVRDLPAVEPHLGAGPRLAEGHLAHSGVLRAPGAGQEQFDLAITGQQDAKTTLDNIAAFQEKLLKEAGHIQE